MDLSHNIEFILKLSSYLKCKSCIWTSACSVFKRNSPDVSCISFLDSWSLHSKSFESDVITFRSELGWSQLNVKSSFMTSFECSCYILIIALFIWRDESMNFRIWNWIVLVKLPSVSDFVFDEMEKNIWVCCEFESQKSIFEFLSVLFWNISVLINNFDDLSISSRKNLLCALNVVFEFLRLWIVLIVKEILAVVVMKLRTGGFLQLIILLQ